MIKFIIIFILCFPLTSYSAVVFEDNFDGYTWNTTGVYDDVECTQTTGVKCAQAPGDWTNIRNLPAVSSTPWMQINSLPSSGTDHTTGGTGGHALIVKYPAQEYTGDCMLSKMLTSQYPELYAQVWIKSQPGGMTLNSNSSNNKMFRLMGIIPGCDNFYSYFSGGCADSIVFNDFGTYWTGTNIAGWVPSIRCGPNSSNYYCSGTIDNYDWAGAKACGSTSCTDQATASGQWNDGNWHRITIHVKMNTSTSLSNGIYEVTYDGQTQIMHDGTPANLTDIQYLKTGSGITGWNAVSLGGNSFGTAALSWMAYDDLVISTTPIAADYVPGGGGASPSSRLTGGTLSGCRIN